MLALFLNRIAKFNDWLLAAILFRSAGGWLAAGMFLLLVLYPTAPVFVGGTLALCSLWFTFWLLLGAITK